MIENNLVTSATAATFTHSVPVDLGDLQTFGLQVTCTGTDVTGTYTLEASNDKSTWVTVDNSSQAITTSQAVFYDVTRSAYRYVRLAFSYTSGTGAISAKLHIKETYVIGV